MSKHNPYREFSDDKIFHTLSIAQYNKRLNNMPVEYREKRYKIIKHVKRVAREILTDKQWHAVRLTCFDHRLRRNEYSIADIAKHNEIKHTTFKGRLRGGQMKLKKYFNDRPELIRGWIMEGK